MMIMKINNDLKSSAFFRGDEKEIWMHGDWLDTNEEKRFSSGWTGIFVIEAEGVTHTYVVEDWYGLAKELGIEDTDLEQNAIFAEDLEEIKLKNLKIGQDFFPEATVLQIEEV